MKRALTLHRPLMLLAGLMILLLPVALAGMFIDGRTLLGAPIWAKPLKFSVSIAIYAISLAWMISLLPKARRLAWWMGTAFAVGMGFEMVLIIGQVVVRGRQLHFNQTTDADRIIHMMLGYTIYVVWAATLIIAILLCFQRLGDRGRASAVRIGLAVALTGMALGMLMIIPTAEQLASGSKAIMGAHSVGVPDGGPGLPLLGWSTTGGDLRIPHFVGMHALQVLPLLAMGLSALARRSAFLRDDRARRDFIRVAGLGYFGLLALLTWQALRGQPITSPDVLTAAASAVLLGVVCGGAAIAAAVHKARRGDRQVPDGVRIMTTSRSPHDAVSVGQEPRSAG